MIRLNLRGWNATFSFCPKWSSYHRRKSISLHLEYFKSRKSCPSSVCITWSSGRWSSWCGNFPFHRDKFLPKSCESMLVYPKYSPIFRDSPASQTKFWRTRQCAIWCHVVVMCRYLPISTLWSLVCPIFCWSLRLLSLSPLLISFCLMLLPRKSPF